MRYAKGIMWLDDCRIPTTEILGREQKSNHNYAMLQGGYNDGYWDNTKGLGRFTPNLLVCDDMLNDGSVSKGQKNPRIQKTTRRYGENNFTNGGLFTPEGNITATYNDMGSSSRYYDLDKWFDKLIDNL
jgi:hypothetical protein